MLSNIGRAAIKRIGGSHLSTNRFLTTLWKLQRVEGQQNVESTLNASSISFLARRLYATETRVAQTRKTVAKKSATKKTPAKKPAAKKPAAKKPAAKKPLAKKKTAKKPAKKPAKKTVKKVKAKPKKKVVLTDAQKLRKQLRELKVAAIQEEPKSKPVSAYQVLFQESITSGKSMPEVAKDTSVKYKTLQVAELERLNHISNENKAANAIAYKKWVESHTPETIRKANLARHGIRRLTKSRTSPRLIKDDRTVKKPSHPLTYFFKERARSGDFAGVKMTEVVKRVSVEYKELSPEQRKPYEDASAADYARYYEEYKTVYKHDAYTKAKALA